MNTNILQTLPSKSLSSSIPVPFPLKPSTATAQNRLTNTYGERSFRVGPISSTSGSSNNAGGNDAPQRIPPPITPPETVEIRFRRRSRRRRQLSEDGGRDKQPLKVQAAANAASKNWEDMTLAEKAVELYMGEKGVLFWLNKFAYASIFIMIGAWILFRFVGPALNLYQLDAPPLSPSSVFNGS